MDQDQISARRRARRRAAPAVIISVVVHTVVFLAVGLIVPKTVFRNYSPDEKPITVALVLPPEHQRARPHAAKTAAAAPQLGRTAPRSVPNVHVTPNPSPAVKPSPLPAPAAPVIGLPSNTPKPGTSIAPGPLPAEENPRGVQALLRRSVGCDYGEVPHLTPEEKEACNKRFGDMARGARPFSAIPDDKRGAYSIQAAADAKKRARNENGMTQPLTACSGPGSNFGVACLPESAMAHIRIP